ncbi:MAG: hypothetical protein HYR56_22725 [Acidobacteria bacterium]|nr:hypothetical protein [Acidobacteriota bacterium]
MPDFVLGLSALLDLVFAGTGFVAGADAPFLLSTIFFAIVLVGFLTGADAAFFVTPFEAVAGLVSGLAGKLLPGFALAAFGKLALAGIGAAFATFALVLTLFLGLAFFVLAAIFSSSR